MVSSHQLIQTTAAAKIHTQEQTQTGGNVGLREFTLNLMMGGTQENSHVDKDDSSGLN